MRSVCSKMHLDTVESCTPHVRPDIIKIELIRKVIDDFFACAAKDAVNIESWFIRVSVVENSKQNISRRHRQRAITSHLPVVGFS